MNPYNQLQNPLQAHINKNYNLNFNMDSNLDFIIEGTFPEYIRKRINEYIYNQTIRNDVSDILKKLFRDVNSWHKLLSLITMNTFNEAYQIKNSNIKVFYSQFPNVIVNKKKKAHPNSVDINVRVYTDIKLYDNHNDYYEKLATFKLPLFIKKFSNMMMNTNNKQNYIILTESPDMKLYDLADINIKMNKFKIPIANEKAILSIIFQIIIIFIINNNDKLLLKLTKNNFYIKTFEYDSSIPQSFVIKIFNTSHYIPLYGNVVILDFDDQMISKVSDIENIYNMINVISNFLNIFNSGKDYLNNIVTIINKLFQTFTHNYKRIAEIFIVEKSKDENIKKIFDSFKKFNLMIGFDVYSAIYHNNQIYFPIAKLFNKMLELYQKDNDPCNPNISNLISTQHIDDTIIQIINYINTEIKEIYNQLMINDRISILIPKDLNVTNTLNINCIQGNIDESNCINFSNLNFNKFYEFNKNISYDNLIPINIELTELILNNVPINPILINKLLFYNKVQQFMSCYIQKYIFINMLAIFHSIGSQTNSVYNYKLNKIFDTVDANIEYVENICKFFTGDKDFLQIQHGIKLEESQRLGLDNNFKDFIKKLSINFMAAPGIYANIIIQKLIQLFFFDLLFQLSEHGMDYYTHKIQEIETDEKKLSFKFIPGQSGFILNNQIDKFQVGRIYIGLNVNEQIFNVIAHDVLATDIIVKKGTYLLCIYKSDKCFFLQRTKSDSNKYNINVCYNTNFNVYVETNNYDTSILIDNKTANINDVYTIQLEL